MLALLGINIWYDIALIGVGIIATLIGGVSMKLLESNFNKIGKLAIYYRVIDIFVHQGTTVITIRVQIKNPSHDVKFLRNISLCRIIEGESVRAIPSEKTTHSKNNVVTSTTIHANEGSYSIASDSRSLVEYELVYIFKNITIRDGYLELIFMDDKENKNIIKMEVIKNDDWIKAVINNK